MISESALRADEEDFASGGFADVRRGELMEKNSGRRRVCLKRIKLAAQEGEEGRMNREKVINPPSLDGRSVIRLTAGRNSMRKFPSGCG